MEQLTIQSLGFPIGFPIGFQEDIKIIKIIKIIIIIIIIIISIIIIIINVVIVIVIFVIIVIIVIMVIMVIIVILACPDTRCESGQTSGSCRNICHGRGTCSTRDVYGPWSSYQEV